MDPCVTISFLLNIGVDRPQIIKMIQDDIRGFTLVSLGEIGSKFGSKTVVVVEMLFSQKLAWSSSGSPGESCGQK